MVLYFSYFVLFWHLVFMMFWAISGCFVLILFWMFLNRSRLVIANAHMFTHGPYCKMTCSALILRILLALLWQNLFVFALNKKILRWFEQLGKVLVLFMIQTEVNNEIWLVKSKYFVILSFILIIEVVFY